MYIYHAQVSIFVAIARPCPHGQVNEHVYYPCLSKILNELISYVLGTLWQNDLLWIIHRG